MEIFDKYSPLKFLLISMIFAVFIIYPNIAFFSFEHEYLGESKHTAHILYFIFRYLFFSGLIWILLRHNLLKLKSSEFRKRLIHTLILTLFTYLIYIGFSVLLSPKPEWYSGMLLFQFFVIFLFCTLIGHVAHLYSEQRRREQEIELLKIENLQSRFSLLMNKHIRIENDGKKFSIYLPLK